MSIRKMLAELHPELKERYNSEQYRLAQKIIAKKLELKVSQPIFSNLLGVSFDKYLDMEIGSVEIPVEEYILALSKANGFTKDNISSEISEVIFKYPSFVLKSMDNQIEQLEFNAQFNVETHSMPISHFTKIYKENNESEIGFFEIKGFDLKGIDFNRMGAGRMTNMAYDKNMDIQDEFIHATFYEKDNTGNFSLGA